METTNHILKEVNVSKTMSSEALTKTLGVLSNLTEKIQYFNTSQEEAKELITVRNCQDFLYSGGYSMRLLGLGVRL